MKICLVESSRDMQDFITLPYQLYGQDEVWAPPLRSEQRKAVDSLLYRALHESLYSSDLWIEINYVLEDNWPMINAIKKLEATPSRRYRVYEMEIH